jgi:putative membrane protein
MKELFSPEEKQRIEAAVSQAEAQTSGEIVPFIIADCGRHEVAVWRAAVVFTIAAAATVLLIFRFYHGWGLAWLHTGWGASVVLLGAALLGGVVAELIPAVKRFFAGPRYLDRRVHQRAMQAFVEEEVFNTRSRTGILIFIALFEHRIEILGDSGINEKVDIDDWAEIVLHLRESIIKGDLPDGLVRAIEECGDLLERSGVAVHDDAPNELSDAVRLRRDA